MFLISKRRGDWDLYLYTTDFRVENRCEMATSEKKRCVDAGKIGLCHCAAILQTQVQKWSTDIDLSLLYILILGTYSKTEK